jgi:positive regulator of sigma E activity
MTEPGEPWGGKKAMEVLALAFVFPLTIWIGWAVGGWIGERLGNESAWALGGVLVGAVAGFWELWAYLRRLTPR